jgi:hypothetical protein
MLTVGIFTHHEAHCQLIQFSYSIVLRAHSAAMKHETILPDQKFVQLGIAPRETDSLVVSMSPQYPARKISIVVATASSELRASSEKTTEIMKRMLVTLSMTAERVAWSRAAIASSRCLLKTTRHLTGPKTDTSNTSTHGKSTIDVLTQ